MTTYRTGNHWGRTIVRSGVEAPDEHGRRPDDQLVAVVDSAATDGLAERICALLNTDDARTAEGSTVPGHQPTAAAVSPNIRVEINADGRHIIVEAPGQPEQLITVALTTWRDTANPTPKPLEAGSGFQLVERAGGPDYTDGYPSAVSPDQAPA